MPQLDAKNKPLSAHTEMTKIIEFTTFKKTKRAALRYNIQPRPITYVADDEIGEATLLNISTTGCMVEFATVPVAVEDEVIISLDFSGSGLQPKEMEIKTKVVRINFDEFAATFSTIDEESKRVITNHFSRDARIRSLAAISH